ncbi:MAG: hypothetical protein HUU35_18555, partial [Armatimonadetes bacterium]|nr:hypothetical protein [Armatimonadota bacterium]
EVVADYQRLKERDPSRPVLLNLGQGVANDQWRGRGSGARQDDYLTYVQGADIVSFDVYPVAGIGKPDGENYLWYVARGVERLRRWTSNRKPIWAVIETTRISSQRRATPAQVRSEAWMALISGASGLLYFAHEFKPKFNEWRLLDDPEMLAGVTALNREILGLAPVLNSPTVEGLAMESSPAEVPVAAMVKQHDGHLWLFAVGLRNAATQATFRLPQPHRGAAEVLGENRRLTVTDGCFSDSFGPYEVHLYRLD